MTDKREHLLAVLEGALEVAKTDLQDKVDWIANCRENLETANRQAAEAAERQAGIERAINGVVESALTEVG